MKAFTLLELLVVVVIVALLIAVVLPIMSRSINGAGSKITSCGSNLSQMTKAMYNYSISKTPVEGEFPREPVGSKWWLILYETEEVEDHKVFWCPFAHNKLRAGQTDYRGPASDPNLLSQGTAIGCCRPGNHGDEEDAPQIWVDKSGSVRKVPANDPQWQKVLQQTRD